MVRLITALAFAVVAPKPAQHLQPVTETPASQVIIQADEWAVALGTNNGISINDPKQVLYCSLIPISAEYSTQGDKAGGFVLVCKEKQDLDRKAAK